MSERQWFHDDEFQTRLPERVAHEVARIYGTGPIAVSFAQSLAAFLAIPDGRASIIETMGPDPDLDWTHPADCHRCGRIGAEDE